MSELMEDLITTMDAEASETSSISEEVVATDAPDEEIIPETSEEETPTEEVVEAEPAGPTPLDIALQKAQQEAQASAASLAQQHALIQLDRTAPKLWRFEELPEEVQVRVLDEAQGAGVDAQTVLYWAYKEQQRAHDTQRATLQGTLDQRRHSAFTSVANFVHGNEHVAKLPPEEKQKFIDGIGQLRAVKAIEPLASVDPFAWAEAVQDIAGNAIAALAASKKQDPGKAHNAMKASVASGKPATQKVQTTTAPSVLDGMDLQSQAWDKRLKAAK